MRLFICVGLKLNCITTSLSSERETPKFHSVVIQLELVKKLLEEKRGKKEKDTGQEKAHKIVTI